LERGGKAQRDAALDSQMPKCEEIQSAAVVGALQISRYRHRVKTFSAAC
jgi:hypothetical protein